MFIEVHSALRLDHGGGGDLVCLVEEEDGLGSFLVHHFLSSSLESQKKVLFLGLEQSLGHYHAVGLKSGINLLKLKESGQLVFLEGLKSIADAYDQTTNDSSFNFANGLGVGQLQQHLQRELERLSKDSRVTVIVDKVSLLLSLGVSADAAIAFARTLQRVTSEAGADCVLLGRRDPDDTDEGLNRLTSYLARTSDLSVICWPLEYGKSSSVTGNLRFEWINGDDIESGRYQFRVEEKDVKVFALGASRAVL
jgi:KaiC/GvpD/RAD55 family RecA-like ATPase